MLNCSYNLGMRHLKGYIPEYPVGTAEVQHSLLVFHRDRALVQPAGTGGLDGGPALLAQGDGKAVPGDGDEAQLVVEVYATTLHYAPCHVDGAKGFRVAVVLPRGTNEARPVLTPLNAEDDCPASPESGCASSHLFFAHRRSSSAFSGVRTGLALSRWKTSREC